jgi:hypothetical protein
VELGPEAGQHGVIALASEGGIGAGAGIFHGAADDHPARPIVQPAAGMRHQLLEEEAPEILEAHRLAEDLRAFEQRAGGDALERLDKAAVERCLEELLDRPGAGLVRDAVPPALLFPKAQGGAEHRAGVAFERDQLGVAVTRAECDHGVGGAEIQAERACHAFHRRFSMFRARGAGAYGSCELREQAGRALTLARRWITLGETGEEIS